MASRRTSGNAPLQTAPRRDGRVASGHGAALAGARAETVALDPAAGWAPDLDAAPAAAALFLNYPSNPCAVVAPDGVFESAVRWAARTGGFVVHDSLAEAIAEPGPRLIEVQM